MHKRTFLKSAALLGIGSLLSLSGSGEERRLEAPWPDDGDDEKFWHHVRNQYDLPKQFINLENGYYCIQPRPILEKYWAHGQDVNREGAHILSASRISKTINQRQKGSKPSSEYRLISSS